MKRIRKIIKTLVIIVLSILIVIFLKDSLGQAFNLFGNKSGEQYHSEYIYVLDRENKTELIKYNENAKAYPASLTKIMTTLVALEHIEDLSALAPVDVKTYQEMVKENASMAGFYGKEATSYRDLLYGTILSSGGEAANSLAINIAGNTEDFVHLMNEKARELGLKGTNFTNVEGLHDKDQYTTAKDMAKLLDYALENGDFKAIFTRPSFQTTPTLDHPGGIMLKSTVLSRLEGIDQDGFKIIGGKSGTTYESGQCWISLGIKEEKEYIAVVMGSKLEDINNPSDKHIEDTLKIYENIK